MPSTHYQNALVTVPWPHDDHIPALRCPVTGMVVSEGFGPDQDPDRDSPLQPADEQCPTLLFRYHYELGLEYVEAGLAEKIAEKRGELIAAGEDEDLLDDFEIITDHLQDLGEALLVIDMPTKYLTGDGVTVGVDLAIASPGQTPPIEPT